MLLLTRTRKTKIKLKLKARIEIQLRFQSAYLTKRFYIWKKKKQNKNTKMWVQTSNELQEITNHTNIQSTLLSFQSISFNFRLNKY